MEAEAPRPAFRTEPVTTRTILAGEDYAPAPGTEYVLMPGVTVTMREPVISLLKECHDKGHGKPYGDAIIALLCTEGAPPGAKPEDCITRVATRVAFDFLSCGIESSEPPTPSDPESSSSDQSPRKPEKKARS